MESAGSKLTVPMTPATVRLLVLLPRKYPDPLTVLLKLRVLAPMLRLPVVSSRLPVMLVVPASETPPKVFVMEILLKLLEPLVMVCAVEPLKVTVPLLAVNVPSLTQLPATERLLAALKLRLLPVLMVILRQAAPAALITGWLTIPVGMITSTEPDGKALPHQLLAVNQSVLVAPFQTILEAVQLPSPI